MEFGEILRELLEQDGISQKQLAAALNLAPSTLGNYIRGLREPDFTTLGKIADYFGVTVDFLLGHTPKDGLSHGEEEILRIYRSLSRHGQALLIAVGNVFLHNGEAGQATE